MQDGSKSKLESVHALGSTRFTDAINDFCGRHEEQKQNPFDKRGRTVNVN